MNRYKYVGQTRQLITKTGLVFTTDFIRIVHGQRGDYIEFTENQRVKIATYVPAEASWRLQNNEVYYIEHRTFDKSKAKLYKQIKTVKYADYKIGFWYVSPLSVQDFEVEWTDSIYTGLEF